MRHRAVILAYDGGLVQSLDARAIALFEGLRAEGIDAGLDQVRESIAGCSFSEALHVVSRQLAATSGTVPDAVAADLAVLRAERAYATMAAGGLPLVPGALAFALDQSARARLVIRADSCRPEVARTLALTDLEPHVTLACCGDDPRPGDAADQGRPFSMIEASFRHVRKRLEGLRIAASECLVCEVAASARDAAIRLGFHVLRADDVVQERPDSA